LSAVRYCLVDIFATIFHSQPEDGPCRGDRDPHNMEVCFKLFLITVCTLQLLLSNIQMTFPIRLGEALWAGLTQWYRAGLRAGWSRVRVLAGAGDFSVRRLVQNGSGAHPASYPVGTRSSFPGGKAAGAGSWPLTSIQCRGQRMRGAIHPYPLYALMAWCSVKAQGHLYLSGVALLCRSCSFFSEAS
jgi:hypothetical protein